MPRGALVRILIALAVPLPALFVRVAGVELPPVYAMLLFGAAVAGAAVVLAWAAEAAQLDISGSLAIALLALIAVLPEYAVDLYFAYTAGHDPEYAQYAAANMTGANRLLIGIGWPLVAVVAALGLRRRRRKKERSSTSDGALPERSADRNPQLVLMPRRRVELLFLGLAGVYAFSIPIRGNIGLVDLVVLLTLYAGYIWRIAREPRSEPELVGICAHIGALGCRRRRILVGGMAVAAAAYILAAAEPFAEGLIHTGAQLGLDQFLLVQWLAPLVSEAPELIVACLLAYRLKGDDALGTLLSSKVNQWTLLVGTLPLAFMIGGGGTGGLVLDARQTEEFLLTAAQTMLGFAVLSNLRFGLREGSLLLALFAAQFVFPQSSVRIAFSFGYIGLAVIILIVQRRSLTPIVRALTPTLSGRDHNPRE